MQRAAADLRRDVRRGQIFNRDMNTGIGLREFRDHGGKQRGVVGVDRADPDAPAHQVAQAVECKLPLVHLLQRAPCIVREGPSGIGQLDPAPDPVEQLRPEQRLKLGDLMRQRGLRDMVIAARDMLMVRPPENTADVCSIIRCHRLIRGRYII